MARIYCPDCSMETEHLTVSQAARSAQVTRTTIYTWLRRWNVHTVRRPSGRQLVCMRSLVVYDRPEHPARPEAPRRSLEPVPPHPLGLMAARAGGKA